MGRGFTAYSIHKKLYPATYNFKDEVVGTSGISINFVDVDNSTASCYVNILAEFDGHKKVLRLYDNNVAGLADIDHNIAAQGYGTIEFFMGLYDVTNPLGFRLEDSGTELFRFRIFNDKFQYHDGDYHDIVGPTPQDNTMHYVKIHFECTAGSYEGLAQYDWKVVIDGTEYGDYDFSNNQAEADNIRLVTAWADGTEPFNGFFDAFGFSWDSTYNVGDNVFWRHYKESTDSFEGDDVGTQGTSITWVDAVNNADDHELVQEFNEHKKILRTYRNSGEGDCYHIFASQSTAGWVAGWFKVTDAHSVNGIIHLREDGVLMIRVQIDNDRFEYDAGAGWVTAGVAAADATWYFIYLQWYADNTFDFWVNNVQYLDGVSTYADFTGSGVNRWYVDQDTAGAEYIYLDAPMSSLDGDVRGDNRTLTYHTYTKTDITDYIISAIKTSNFYEPFQFIFKANKDFYFDEVFFQFLDINDKLAYIGEMKNRIQNGKIRTYPCRDITWDEYNEPINQAFSSAKIHDPSDSTSMLKVALSTVGQVDGDLILVNADTKTDTYSPTLKNYPTELFLRDLADIADSNIIHYANGIIGLDDDLASGITLDVDTAAHKDKMITPPLLNNIIESFNYFEIFGAIDLDTGERYYKVIDNSGTDKKHKYRYVNNNFRNQTDVDAYTTKIAARLVTALQITQSIQDLGALELGTTINYKYVDANADINIPQANYVIIREKLFLHQNKSRLTFSEGVIESSKYANYYEKALENINAYAAGIYETDIVTVYPPPIPGTGAGWSIIGVQLDAVGDEFRVWFLADDKIDANRDIVVTFTWFRSDAGGDTLHAHLFLSKIDINGGGGDIIHNNIGITLDACGLANLEHYVLTIDSSDVTPNRLYYLLVSLEEAAKQININTVTVRYYQFRSTS